jgi:transketolase
MVYLPEQRERVIAELEEKAKIARAAILRMTSVAGSGHPGGSMSSIDLLLAVYAFARISPENYLDENRDRVVVSHGHVSPAVYSTLALNGFFDLDEVIATFRLAGSRFEGHIERHLPGIEWTTGNLGQGLSAGCGLALAAKVKDLSYQVFVVMSDAEQAKGQVGEARRFAKKYNLNNLTVLIDYNHMQISGRVETVMPVNIRENYLADGWEVIEIDGHDFNSILEALEKAVEIDSPVCILAETVMGKGVSFMEHNPEYHGRALTKEEFEKAMQELGFDSSLDRWLELRKLFKYDKPGAHLPHQEPFVIHKGEPRTYAVGAKIDNRTAFGNALLDIGRENISRGQPVVAFDCDLAGSVKVNIFAGEFPQYFFEAGVSEHNTAATAGALSTQKVLTFLADFGVIGLDEVYNQQRLNDINATNLKVVLTHCGIDVGEDGRTHHCLDYIGAARNFFGFKVIVPADPNQTDRAIRYAASTHGNFIIAMGRSAAPVIPDGEGRPLFGDNYEFRYGSFDWIRKGDRALVLCYGNTAYRGYLVHEILKKQGIEVGVINVPCPLDLHEELLDLVASYSLTLVYEDHHLETGLYAELCKALVRRGIRGRIAAKGVGTYAPSGKAEDLYRLMGLDAESIAEEIKTLLEE